MAARKTARKKKTPSRKSKTGALTRKETDRLARSRRLTPPMMWATEPRKRKAKAKRTR